MSKVAVLSDIHSNYFAFSACFEDAKAKGAEAFVFLGDYVTDFPDARKTLDLIYRIKSEYPCHIIRGNRERYMLEHRNGKLAFSVGSKTGSWLFNYEQLNDHDLDYFESLPISDCIELFGVDLEISHSGRDNDRVFFEKGDNKIGEIFSQMQKDYLLTGHSHKQYTQLCDGKVIINPGSVGLPRGSACRAQYSMLDVANSRVDCTHYQVEYDVFAAISRHFESGFIDYANCWAISALYDVITGVEYTARLLYYANKAANGNSMLLDDESVWESVANSLDMKFTEKEILDLARKFK